MKLFQQNYEHSCGDQISITLLLSVQRVCTLTKKEKHKYNNNANSDNNWRGCGLYKLNIYIFLIPTTMISDYDVQITAFNFSERYCKHSPNKSSFKLFTFLSHSFLPLILFLSFLY